MICCVRACHSSCRCDFSAIANPRLYCCLFVLLLFLIYLLIRTSTAADGRGREGRGGEKGSHARSRSFGNAQPSPCCSPALHSNEGVLKSLLSLAATDKPPHASCTPSEISYNTSKYSSTAVSNNEGKHQGQHTLIRSVCMLDTFAAKQMQQVTAVCRSAVCVRAAECTRPMLPRVTASLGTPCNFSEQQASRWLQHTPVAQQVHSSSGAAVAEHSAYLRCR